jgi:Ca2+-binding EF-hand superfamily protein
MSGARRVTLQKGRRNGPFKENKMSVGFKSSVAALALLGTVVASVAYAEKGYGGGMGDGMGDRGGMLLEMFDAIDTDSDGKLSMAELAAHRLAEFTAADTNSDGALDATEMATHQQARMEAMMAERAARMIENRDNDGNGSLSADEFGEGPGQQHFARLDTDNDGAISREEAEAGMQHRKKRGHGWGMGEGMGEGMGNN